MITPVSSTFDPSELNPKKDRKRQMIAIGILLLVAVIYFSAVLLRPAPDVSSPVEVYFADRMTTAHHILIDRYNDQMKGSVKIIPVDFPNFDFSTNERKELLARALRGKETGIDILAVDLIWVQRFAKWCEPLENHFSSAEIQELLTVALQSCYYDGELYAMPLNLVQGVLYYREDLVSKLPDGNALIQQLNNGITWEELLKWKRKTDPEKPFYIYPAASYEGLICSFTEILLSQNPRYFVKNGFNFNTPEATKSLGFLADLVGKFRATPNVVTDFTEIPSFEYFLKSDAYFIRGWPTYDMDFRDSPFDKEKLSHLRKVRLPYLENANPASVFGGWNLMVSKFSSKKKESVDFIRYLLRTESQEVLFREAGYYPVTRQLYTDSVYQQKYPDLAEYESHIEIGVHRPRHVEYTKYSEIMSAWFSEAIKGKIGVHQALEQATSAIKNEALERENGF